MALNADAIRVAANGTVRVAPYGTAAPTTDNGSYSASWLDVGYISEEGVKRGGDRSVDFIKGWQSFNDVRPIVTGEELSLEFELIELNSVTIPLAFGGGTITQPTAGHFKYTPPSPETIDYRAIAIDWSDGSINYRWIAYKAFLESLSDVTFARGDAVRLPVKFRVLGASSGDTWDLYTNDTNWSA